MIKLSGPLTLKIDRASDLYKKLSDANARLAKKDSTLWGPAAQAEAAPDLSQAAFEARQRGGPPRRQAPMSAQRACSAWSLRAG